MASTTLPFHPPMPAPYRIALLGFSASERELLVATFAAGLSRWPTYGVGAGANLLPMLDDADFVVADGDHAPSVQLVVVTERVGDTLFIGAGPPVFGAAAWMPRPLDPQHLLRELDALVSPVLGGGDIELPLALAPAVPPLPPFPELPHLPPSQAATAVPPPWHPWTPPASTRRLRALVVDDSETARQFLRMRLEAWGLQVDMAASSGQALAMLFRQHFDHLFIDVELGAGSQLDGLGLCQLVRRKNLALGGAPELVVIVSAHAGHVDRARGTLAGCDAYLGKPLDEADLGQLLRRQGLKPPADSMA